MLDFALQGTEKLYLREYELKWRKPQTGERDQIMAEYEGRFHESLLNGNKLALLIDEMPSPDR
jgi:uncharacterized membrane protein